MKKNRLLEIIREEIAGALSEETNVTATNAKGETDVFPYNTPADKLEIARLKKDSNIKSIKTTGGQKIKEDNLEEDTLNEMAYDIIISQPNELAKLQDKIKDSTKKGEQKLAKALEIIQKTKKEGKPIRQRDIANEMGLIQQEINPLINKLIDVGILEKGESVTGVTKKKITDKPQGKPAKEKTTPAPKAEPMDDEDKEAAQNVGSDSTAKELGKEADVSKNPDFDRIRKGLQNKRKNSKDGILSPEDMKLAINIINTAKDKYKFNTTQVDSLRADIGL
jgi:Mn-dependent DtxR family transcriptional regulator